MFTFKDMQCKYSASHRIENKFDYKLKRLSHRVALPRSCLIFQSTVRTQENHDIFGEKLSARRRRCHGALMAFYRVPTLFMVEILCALTVL